MNRFSLKPTASLNRFSLKPTASPWGPAWAVPVLVWWRIHVGAYLSGSGDAGPLTFVAYLVAVSVWVALPFLALGAVDAWRPIRGFRVLAVGGAAATALAWLPLYYVAAVAWLGGPLGYWGPLAYPALASPFCGVLGMALGAAFVGP